MHFLNFFQTKPVGVNENWGVERYQTGVNLNPPTNQALIKSKTIVHGLIPYFSKPRRNVVDLNDVCIAGSLTRCQLIGPRI